MKCLMRDVDDCPGFSCPYVSECMAKAWAMLEAGIAERKLTPICRPMPQAEE